MSIDRFPVRSDEQEPSTPSSFEGNNPSSHEPMVMPGGAEADFAKRSLAERMGGVEGPATEHRTEEDAGLHEQEAQKIEFNHYLQNTLHDLNRLIDSQSADWGDGIYKILGFVNNTLVTRADDNNRAALSEAAAHLEQAAGLYQTESAEAAKGLLIKAEGALQSLLQGAHAVSNDTPGLARDTSQESYLEGRLGKL